MIKTEEQIRQEIKKELRRGRLSSFLYGLKNVGLFILMIALVVAFIAPIILHLENVQHVEHPIVALDETGIIVTGILAIFPLTCVFLGLIMIIFAVILDIKDKHVEERLWLENEVERRKNAQRIKEVEKKESE